MTSILITDDNKSVRVMLRLLLEDYEEEDESVAFELDEAENGQIAVDMCNKNQ